MGNTNQQIYGLSCNDKYLEAPDAVLDPTLLSRYFTKPIANTDGQAAIISALVRYGGPGRGDRQYPLNTPQPDLRLSSGVIAQQGEMRLDAGGAQLWNGFSLQMGGRYIQQNGDGWIPTIDVALGDGTPAGQETYSVTPLCKGTGRWVVVHLVIMNTPAGLTSSPKFMLFINGVRTWVKDNPPGLQGQSLPGDELRMLNGLDAGTFPSQGLNEPGTRNAPLTSNLGCVSAVGVRQTRNPLLVQQGGPFDLQSISFDVLNSASVSIGARRLYDNTPLNRASAPSLANPLPDAPADLWDFRSTNPVASASYDNRGSVGNLGPAVQNIQTGQPDPFIRGVFDNSIGGQEAREFNPPQSFTTRLSEPTEF